MFTLCNHEDATVIGGQAGARILLSLAFIGLILTVVACQRPPGEAFPLAQHVDAQVGSHSIQPLTQAIPVAQLLPVHAGPQEDLLGRIGSILMVTEQTVNIGINWPSEPLVEEGEHPYIFRKECRIDPWSGCRRLLYTVRMSPFPPSVVCRYQSRNGAEIEHGHLRGLCV